MDSVEELGQVNLEQIYTMKNSTEEKAMTSRPRVNARLEFERRGGDNKPDSFGLYRTNASELFYTYPLKLMLPAHASTSNCQWVYSINYGGGIVSGDNVEIQMDVKDACCAMLTTQASTKVYHSEDDMTSQQRLEGRVGSGSVLAVLQDPVTCFAGARYRQLQTFKIEKDGNLVFMDWLTAGRIARGERWDFTSYSSCNSVYYDSTIIHRDAVCLESTPLLDVKKTMRHYDVIASLVLVGQKFAEVSKSVVQEYGASQDYGTKQSPDLMMSASPIGKTVAGNVVPGVIVKIASTAVSKVYEQVEEILQPIFPMLGGNPFEDKH